MQSDAPAYSRKRHRQVFLTMAAAEMALLSILILSFIRYRLTFDNIQMAAVLMVALAAGSWMVRHSFFLAQIVFLVSLVSLEVMLLVEPPFGTLSIFDIVWVTSDYLPLFFLVVDIAVLWFFVIRQGGAQEEEEEEDKEPAKPKKR